METEAKYVVSNPDTFQQLLALPALGEYVLREDGTRQLEDHYFDTAERALYRGGYALRRRDIAGQAQQRITVKGLGRAEGAVHEREEHELEIEPGALPADWPAGPARDIVLGLAGEAALVELFAVQQQRHSRQVWRAERCVAELSLDEVRLASASGGEQSLELEIELCPDGALDDLHDLGEALQTFALQPQGQSKFKRGLALLEARPAAESEPKLARPKSPGVRADEHMAEAGRKVLRFHYDRMLAQEDGTRAGEDIEAVHDMRVATRRQRAALRLFAEYFKPKVVGRFEKELRELASGLGAVRDLDVQLEGAHAYHGGLGPEDAAAFTPLLDAWKSERDAARQALMAYLDGRAYRKFKKAYGGFVETRGRGVRSLRDHRLRPVLVRQVLPGQLWSLYGCVRAYEFALPGAPVETLHALRIEAKRLRYALEFFAEVLDPNLSGVIEDVVALQDHLGELHDADVSRWHLQAFLDELGPDPAQMNARRAVWAYLNNVQSKLRSLQRSIVRPWRSVMRRKLRFLLARAMAAL